MQYPTCTSFLFLAFTSAVLSSPFAKRQDSPQQLGYYIEQVKTAVYAVNIIQAGNASAVCTELEASGGGFQDQGYNVTYAETLICETAVGFEIFPDPTQAAADLQDALAGLTAVQNQSSVATASFGCPNVDTSTLDEAGLNGTAIWSAICSSSPPISTVSATGSISSISPPMSTGSMSASLSIASSNVSSISMVPSTPIASSASITPTAGSSSSNNSNTSNTAPATGSISSFARSISITSTLGSNFMNGSISSSVQGTNSFSSSFDSSAFIAPTPEPSSVNVSSFSSPLPATGSASPPGGLVSVISTSAPSSVASTNASSVVFATVLSSTSGGSASITSIPGVGFMNSSSAGSAALATCLSSSVSSANSSSYAASGRPGVTTTVFQTVWIDDPPVSVSLPDTANVTAIIHITSTSIVFTTVTVAPSTTTTHLQASNASIISSRPSPHENPGRPSSREHHEGHHTPPPWVTRRPVHTAVASLPVSLMAITRNDSVSLSSSSVAGCA